MMRDFWFIGNSWIKGDFFYLFLHMGDIWIIVDFKLLVTFYYIIKYESWVTFQLWVTFDLINKNELWVTFEFGWLLNYGYPFFNYVHLLTLLLNMNYGWLLNYWWLLTLLLNVNHGDLIFSPWYMIHIITLVSTWLTFVDCPMDPNCLQQSSY